MQAEVLHLQTKVSPSPEGLKLGRSRLTHAAVIPATASSQAGTMGTLRLSNPSGGFKHCLLFLFTVLSILKSVLLAKQGDKKSQINKQV